jgi:hypothetical protein
MRYGRAVSRRAGLLIRSCSRLSRVEGRWPARQYTLRGRLVVCRGCLVGLRLMLVVSAGGVESGLAVLTQVPGMGGCVMISM